MTDHNIDIIAVHVLDGTPYAARCSCGLSWEKPEFWVDSAEKAAEYSPDCQAGSMADADHRARQTYSMWKTLHPSVPLPRPRKTRPEVVRRLATELMGDLEATIFGTEMLAMAFAATDRELSEALSRAMGLDPSFRIQMRDETP